MNVGISIFYNRHHKEESAPYGNANLTSIVQVERNKGLLTTILHPTNARSFLSHHRAAAVSNEIKVLNDFQPDVSISPGRYYCLERPNAKNAASVFLSQKQCGPYSPTVGPVIYREALVSEAGEVATRAKFFMNAQDALRYVGNEQYRCQDKEALRFDKAAVISATLLEYQAEKRREIEAPDDSRFQDRNDTLGR